MIPARAKKVTEATKLVPKCHKSFKGDPLTLVKQCLGTR